MTTDEFVNLVRQGHESPAVEFKPGAPRSSGDVFARVARAVLALANRKDGGWVIVGVEEDSKAIVLKGLEAADLPSWNHDDVSAGLNALADPFVSVDVEVVRYESKNFVVIRVHEFEQVPVICRRDVPAPKGEGRPLLRDGACYVRSRRKPESSEIPTQTEMRELLDLAIDKGVRTFLRRSSAVAGAAGDTDDRNYDAELEAAMKTRDQDRELAGEIRSRGHWEFVVRSEGYQANRIENPAELIPLIHKIQVENGGWQLPFVAESAIHLDHDWIGQSHVWEHQREVWRLFRSGQFYWLGGIPWDWRDLSGWWPAKDTSGWKPNDILLVPSAIQTLTAMVEVAARLAETGATGNNIRLCVVLGRATGRSLISDEWMLRDGRTADVDEVPVSFVATRRDLLAKSRETALDVAARIFRMFRWSPTHELLAGIQDNVRPR